MNPFITQGYVGPEYFCDRETETEKLAGALRNGRNVALISPRRLGKTGLILHAFHRLMEEDANRRCFYIDIFNTENQYQMVQELSKNILGKMDSLSEVVMKNLTTALRSCRPWFGIDPLTGFPNVTLDFKPQESEATLKEVISYMQNSGHECFVAIDEFQQIVDYPEKGTEALLRSVAQFTPNVHFVFAGSKKDLMTSIFSSPKRPFYQSVQRMGLDPLNKQTYYDFASRWMQSTNKILPKQVFDEAYQFARGYTWYIQDIMNRLYELDDNDLSIIHLHRIFKDIYEEGETVYKDYCELFAKGQLRLLRAIAREDIVEKPFDAAFMLRHGLTAASSVRLALKALEKANIVAKSPDGYYIYDRYFSLWLSFKSTAEPEK